MERATPKALTNSTFIQMQALIELENRAKVDGGVQLTFTKMIDTVHDEENRIHKGDARLDVLGSLDLPSIRLLESSI